MATQLMEMETAVNHSRLLSTRRPPPFPRKYPIVEPAVEVTTATLKRLPATPIKPPLPDRTFKSQYIVRIPSKAKQQADVDEPEPFKPSPPSGRITIPRARTKKQQPGACLDSDIHIMGIPILQQLGNGTKMQTPAPLSQSSNYTRYHGGVRRSKKGVLGYRAGVGLSDTGYELLQNRPEQNDSHLLEYILQRLEEVRRSQEEASQRKKGVFRRTWKKLFGSKKTSTSE